MGVRRRDMMKGGALAVSGLAVGTPVAAKTASTFGVTDLRVCGVTMPLALADCLPRFSWKILSDDGTFVQGAYRICVARSEGDLAARRNLVWDSGQVRSGATFDIAYDGPAAGSRARFWWSVEIWDAKRKCSVRSRSAMWETGLNPEDWSAQWLASEDVEAKLDRLAGLYWVEGTGSIPEDGQRYYRTVITAERGETGTLLISCTGLDRVWINGTQVAPDSPEPLSYTTMETYQLPLRTGRNVIAVTQKRKIAYNIPGAILAAIVRLADGQGGSRRITSESGWKFSPAAPQNWTSLSFDDSAWPDVVKAKRTPTGDPWPVSPAMHLRRRFGIDKQVASARLYATALGCYEPWMNGAKIGDRRMAPEMTDPSKRILYQAYDVTDMLQSGENMLGLWVGDGWYGSEFAEMSRFTFGPAPCRVLAQLELQYADGSREVIGTGDGWTTTPSAVLSSEIYDGEVYDARREVAGWAMPATSDEGWRAAETVAGPDIPVDPQIMPPIRVTRTLEPAGITQPKPGVYVVDFGQNFAGWARLKVQGAKGTQVDMRFAEILLPSGEVDQSNLRSAFARDTYILKGEGEEIWEPRFTYHGFRYVEIHGLPQAPGQDTLTGMVAHNDLPITGAFRVGDPVIQKFWRNSVWSQRSNFFGLPTDCPQRDERVAWTGDVAVFWPAASYNMDVHAYTARVMEDVRTSQLKTGGFPDAVPPFVPNYQTSSPGWADVGVILPYTAWLRYGDTGIISESWSDMERYLAYILERNPNHLWEKVRGRDLADWLAVDADLPGDATTPKDLIGTAFWAYDARMMAEMAQAIGRTDDAERYRALFAKISDAFVKKYVAPDGVIGNGSQTSYVLPIRFGLLPPALKIEAGRRLAANIAERGNKLSTGFLGTPHILDALDDAGQVETAITLLLQRDYPSWGYMVEQGATTMWERWDSDAGDRTMNSFNHYAFGAITDYLFRRVAGIAPMEPGFRRVRIAPVFDARLGHGGADYLSIAGPIKTDWAYEDGSLALSVELPPNVEGEVVLPGRKGEIRLNRRSLASSRQATEKDGTTRVTIGPGRHKFAIAQ